MLNTKKYSILIIACLFSAQIKPNSLFSSMQATVTSHPYYCSAGAAAFIAATYFGHKKFFPTLFAAQKPGCPTYSTLSSKSALSSSAHNSYDLTKIEMRIHNVKKNIARTVEAQRKIDQQLVEDINNLHHQEAQAVEAASQNNHNIPALYDHFISECKQKSEQATTAITELKKDQEHLEQEHRALTEQLITCQKFLEQNKNQSSQEDAVTAESSE